MFNFNKTSEFLICIDSERTIINSMINKHQRCFGPVFLDVFNINANKKKILDFCNDMNSFNDNKGFNRFKFLVQAIEFSHKYGYEFEGFKELKKWFLETNELSDSSLEKYLKDNKHINGNCINLALLWSKKVNLSIKALPISEPFCGVKEILNDLNEVADIVGVSNANEDAINEILSKQNLNNLFKGIATQDDGSKKKIIHDALCVGYNKKLTIMVGDALSDYEAALENGVYFFPIIPRREIYSWNKLKNEGVKKLTNYQFDDNYQKQILDEFLDSLNS